MKTRPNDNAEKTILIDVNPYRTRVALLENGLPVEFYFERRDKKRLVGNIYKGRVQNVLPGMFASFIEINEERNAFLYAGDIKPGNGLLEGEQIEGEMTPSMICDIIRVGQDIMVQIVKEPIGTKGARASTQISLPGRTLVFMPTVDFIGISKRISDDAERKRLKKIVSDMLPEGTGVIVRTAAEGLDEDLIKQDLNSLLEEWEQINRRFSSGKAPCLIHKEGSLLFRTARDMLGGNVKSVMINDRVQYDLLCRIADPAIKDRIELNESAGDLFAYMNIDGALDAALSRKVWLKSGAYIVIDQTEALTSIDVNTGKYVGSYSLEKTIVETNKEAAAEIARQLRLRDIGGIVIIDFIDMLDPRDREAVIYSLNEALKCDSTKTVVLGMTGLGLVEVTRKKLGTNISSWLQQSCPYCGGTGKILSAETVALKLRRDLIDRMNDFPNDAEFTVTAHPDIIKLLEDHLDEEYAMNPSLGTKTIIRIADPALHREEYVIKNI